MTTMQQQDFLVELEIKSHLIRERYYRDSCQWDRLRDSYYPDSAQTLLHISWFSGNIDEFIERSKHMATSGTGSLHSVQPAEVHFDESRTKALAFSTGYMTINFEFEGVEYNMMSWLRWVTRLQKSEKCGWRIVRYESIYDHDCITPTKPIDKVPDINTSGYRASYKYLTWALSLRGYTIDQDQPGTDDEKTVKKLVDGGYDWLRSGP